MCILVQNVIIAPISRARLPSDGTCRMQVVTEVGENRRAFPQKDSRNFLNSVLFLFRRTLEPIDFFLRMGGCFNLSESPLSQMWWLHLRSEWESAATWIICRFDDPARLRFWKILQRDFATFTIYDPARYCSFHFLLQVVALSFPYIKAVVQIVPL